MTTKRCTLAREAVLLEFGSSADHVGIGVSHTGLIQTADAWPGARVLVKSGPDVADLALLDVLRHEDIASRFDEVVLVPSEEIFADTVATLGASGLHVIVIGHTDHEPTRLRLAAEETGFIVTRQARIGGGP